MLPAKLAREEEDATRRSVGRCLSPSRGVSSVQGCVCECVRVCVSVCECV